MHVLTIVETRMQSIDYANKGNFRGALKDVVSKGFLKQVFLCGLPLSMLTSLAMGGSIAMIRVKKDFYDFFDVTIRDEETGHEEYRSYKLPNFPIVLAGLLVSQPLIVIASRVMYAGHERSQVLAYTG